MRGETTDVGEAGAHPVDWAWGRPGPREFFGEWDLDLLGWSLVLAADFDPRPSRWGLYCQWLRCYGTPWSVLRWLGSFASLTLCVGPVAVSVSALRTREETKA